MKKLLFFALAGLLTLGTMSSCKKEDSSVPVVGVGLNPAMLTLAPGASETLTVVYMPEKATNKKVTFESSNPAVAAVNADGLVTAVMDGTAIITVTSEDGGKTGTCEVTVSSGGGDEPAEPIAVTGVMLSAETLELEIEATEVLRATVLPANADNKAVTWSSSDADIASVSNNGTVTGINVGTATITVTTVDGEFTASAEVTVTEAPNLSGVQDFETDDASNYRTQDAPAGDPPVIVTSGFTADGEGAFGKGRALTVSYDAAGANDWDAQLFFMIAPVEVGKTYKFSMDVKSDAAVTIGTQSHTTPGNYLHWDAVGQINSTTEWQHYEWVGTIVAEQAGMQTIAFNLNVSKTPTTFYFDNLKWVEVEEVLAQQTFEAADPTGFSTQGVPADDPDGRPVVSVTTALTADSEGAYGKGKALAVSYEVAGDVNATNAWDAQFFFEVGEAVVGETYTFSMDVKSDVAATFETQTHAAPSGYIIYYAVGNVSSTTEWTHYEATVTIAADQTGMGAIAFNLSPAASGPKNTYYFDNITWIKM